MNQTLWHSEVYTTTQSEDNGINAAKRVAAMARIVDRT
ncbi:DUF1508 domain-containing protein [Mesorhizobium amorphae]